MLFDQIMAWLMTLSAAFMVISAIGGGSWAAAWFAGAAAWFAWGVVVLRGYVAHPAPGGTKGGE